MLKWVTARSLPLLHLEDDAGLGHRQPPRGLAEERAHPEGRGVDGDRGDVDARGLAGEWTEALVDAAADLDLRVRVAGRGDDELEPVAAAHPHPRLEAVGEAAALAVEL